MNRLYKISLVIIVLASFCAAGCASSKKGHCGCPYKTGMVGYK